MMINGAFQQDTAEKNKPPVDAGSAGVGTVERSTAGQVIGGAGVYAPTFMSVWRDWNRKTGGWIGSPYTGPPHHPVENNPYHH